jgi:phage tail sheath protein FI
MPIQPTYPGVYVQELPSGTHNIAGVSTSTTAFVGYLRRGPLNIPVQCFNFGDFQRVFGGLDPESATSFQVSQFFLNGGNDAWISRLYAATPEPVQPGVTLSGMLPPASTGGGGGSGSKTPSPPASAPVLTLESQSAGKWGEDIFVTVDYMSNAANTFNLTATLYAESSNSQSNSSSFSVMQSQSLPGVTLDPSKPNSIFEVLQASPNPFAGLIAIPPQTTTSATPVPYASGTVLTFTAPARPIDSLILTVTVVPPTPAVGKAPAPLKVIMPSGVPVTVVSDLVAAVQGAMSYSAGKLHLPGLAGAIVRSCNSPFPPPPPTGGGSSSAQSGPVQLVHVMVPDPAYAGYLIGISASPTQPFTTLQTNYQAQRMAPPAPTGTPPPPPPPGTPPPNPDGKPPGGFDLAGNSTNRTGIYALDAMQIVNLICVPDMPTMDSPSYLTAATAVLNYALQRRAFAILDIPAAIATPSQAVSWITNTPGTLGTGIISAAAYFPQVEVPTPFSTTPQLLGASGTMAGLYAATDAARGVWKAPAGITAPLAGVQQLQYVMNDTENGLINPLGLNALRTFPVYNNIAWGARTLAAGNVADDDWKYISVRRLALYIEQSLVQGLQWVVFEPNDETLWAQIRLSINSFLHPLFVQGAFAGSTPASSYQVMCDASTTTSEDMDNGIVNILILFAPVRPAEFVVISLQQMAGQSSS